MQYGGSQAASDPHWLGSWGVRHVLALLATFSAWGPVSCRAQALTKLTPYSGKILTRP